MLSRLKLENILFLDIETVPVVSSFDQLTDDWKALWERKMQFQVNEEQTADTLYPRAGIYAEFGKIICISIGAYTSNNTGLKLKTFYGDDEKEILEGFAKLLNSLHSNIILCAHNGKEFDFPYLCRRMLINGIKLPSILEISGKKPWEINHIDTMELWKFGDYKHYTSLNLLSLIFNIPTSKDDIDGSDVHRVYWEEKDLERIKKYCQKDVITVAQLLLKFKGLDLITEDKIIYS
jgi:3'-5' exonuclease